MKNQKRKPAEEAFKISIAVFELGKLPISEKTKAALNFRFQEWIEVLTYEKPDATPAFFAVVSEGTKITPEFNQKIKAKYGWVPRYCGLVRDDA
jgi:hypothetical protein